MNYFLCFLLFAVGGYGLLVKKNMIRLIISTMIITYAVHFFFVLVGYSRHADAPILEKGSGAVNMVDPLPQALVMVSIIISMAMTALIVAVALRLYRRFGTFDITRMARIKE